MGGGFCRRLFAPEEGVAADQATVMTAKLADLEETLATLKQQLTALNKK